MSANEVVGQPGRVDDRRRQVDQRHGVDIPATTPLDYHAVVVLAQGVCVIRPQQDNRVMAPTAAFAYRLKYLSRLDALLAQPTVVERLGRLNETAMREKGLNFSLLTKKAQRGCCA